MTTIVTFVFFTALVAVLTWLVTRGKSTNDETDYFLAGRSLTGGFIAGSLLLTNLSTEQLVGLNGGAFKEGLSVMAWEVVAGCSLVFLALFFLPRYLKSGIATIPQFLEERYGPGVRSLTTAIFIVAYMLILLPFVLYSGATGLSHMLDLEANLGMGEAGTIWTVVIVTAAIGSAYAIFGGLRAVAVSDTFNGFGLLVGGLMITWFSLKYAAGETGTMLGVFEKVREANPDAMQSLGAKGEDVHWPTLFTGVLLLNFFYWTTNQQIIQRTFAAKNLAEGQKGVLLASFFKILAPIILVIPGMVAAYMVTKDTSLAAQIDGDDSKVYGALVRTVLPAPLTGFFAAVVIGSILSTFNSVLNSSATLFSLGVYQKTLRPNASHADVVRSGKICSTVVAVFSVIFAPSVFMNVDGIFGFFQKLNGVYFIPLLAVIMFGMFNKIANEKSALITLYAGLAIMVWGTFFDGREDSETGDILAEGWIKTVFNSGYHFMGTVFLGLVILQFLLTFWMKRDQPYVQKDAGLVDLTPWRPAPYVGAGLIFAVIGIYIWFAR
ncbi:MAG: solute:sodium symporter family transporter [Verrucomicrobia bacterium]|nr:solute:sodium symporter family transporter [Verrucomicrobiota bacterium]